jgi:hypothetical protein
VKLELRHVTPIRAANVVSLLYAAAMLLVSVPMFILFSVLPEPVSADPQRPQIAFSVFRWVFLAYPVFGLVFGWLGGLIGSFLYNLISGKIGGLLFDYDSITPQTSQPAA